MTQTKYKILTGSASYTFLLLSFIFILFFGLMLIMLDKGDLVLYLNNNYSYVAGQFFRFVTYMGDGWLYAILGIVLLIWRYYYFLLLAMVALVQTIFVHIFKQWLARDIERPKAYFDGILELQFIPGVDPNSYHAFPSGHTATAFAIFTLLTLLFKNRLLAVVFFFAGFLVALSRVYILQHFLVDVYFGAIFGIFSSYLVYIYFETKTVLPENVKWHNGLKDFWVSRKKPVVP